jgi:hypothetical protein
MCCLTGQNHSINGTFVFQLESPVKLHSGKIHLDKPEYRWQSHNGSIPVNRPFTWYKATIDAPAGEEPVVVDLLGLCKGAAWVNGHSLGRYWPSYTASAMDGCHVCDYRGKFKAEGDGIRCLTGCGEPS